MQAVSETGYLVLVYQCWRRLVKSFFYSESGFSMAIVWGGEIVIGCVSIENRWRKAVSQCTVHAWVGTSRPRQVGSRFALHGGNRWATR